MPQAGSVPQGRDIVAEAGREAVVAEVEAARRLLAAVAAHAEAREWRHFSALPSDAARMHGVVDFYRREEAARCGVLPAMLQQRDADGRTPLLCAVAGGRFDVAADLLAALDELGGEGEGEAEAEALRQEAAQQVDVFGRGCMDYIFDLKHGSRFGPVIPLSLY